MWELAGVTDRQETEEELTLFPSPRASDGTKGGPNMRGSSGDLMLPSAVMRLDD
jgi:DNA (cytosine-5)-methyltransferase 1